MLPSAQLSATVLLAERDAVVRDTIAAGLAEAGYQVEAAPVDASLRATLGRDWDILILDISAVAFLKRTDGGPCPPILVLMADTFTPEDAIMALQNLGADGLLEKPIHIGVLVATLASLRRRQAKLTAAFQLRREAPRGGEKNNIWSLSPTLWTITCPSGKVAQLTRTETDFLLQLARVPCATVPRDDLISSMGHDPEIYDTRRLDVFISRLRGKVSRACSGSLPLRSVYTVGYAFAAPLLLID